MAFKNEDSGGVMGEQGQPALEEETTKLLVHALQGDCHQGPLGRKARPVSLEASDET